MSIILTIISLFLAAILMNMLYKNEVIVIQTAISLIILIFIGLVLIYVWPEGNKEYFSYNNLYKISYLKTIFLIQYLIAGLVVILFTSYYTKGQNVLKLPKEYYILIIYSLIGGILIILSNNLISLIISLELQSFGVYLAASIKNKHLLSIKSALKYFLLGGLSTTYILLGIAIIYYWIGSADYESLRLALGNTEGWKLGLVLILIYVGLSFKLALVPFHSWAPDVYDGVPTIVTAWINIMPKLPILYVIIFRTKRNNGSTILFLVIMLSLLLATILGVLETRIKRLFVYSSIGNISYVVIAKILYLNTVDLSCCYIYLVSYVIANLAVFFILIAIGSLDKTKIERDPSREYSAIQLVSDLKSQWFLNKFLSFSLILTLLSLAGIPFLFGFYGKLFILKTVIDNGLISIVIIIITSTLISSYYYLKVIKTVLFNIEEINLTKKFDNKTVKFDSVLLLIISILVGFLIIFTLTPSYITSLSTFLTALFI